MAALNFPSNPSNGDTYVGPNGVTYTFNSIDNLWTAVGGGGSGGSGAPPASAVEAATGIIFDKYSSPLTAIAKSGTGYSGAALIPGGNNAARPGAPVVGMLRYNSQSSPAVMEYWDGTTWVEIPSSASISLPPSGVTAGSYTNTSLTVNSQGVVTAASNGSATSGVAYAWGRTVETFSSPNWVATLSSGSGITVSLDNPSVNSSDFIYTFNTPLPNTNYVVLVSPVIPAGENVTTWGSAAASQKIYVRAGSLTTGGFRVAAAGSTVNSRNHTVAVFGA